MKNLHKDAALIKSIGVTKLARRLGMTPQRVQNWLYRGIPARVLLNNPRLFARKKKDQFAHYKE